MIVCDKGQGLRGLHMSWIPELCGHKGVVGHGHQLWVLTGLRLHPQWRLQWQRLRRWLLLRLLLVSLGAVI